MVDQECNGYLGGVDGVGDGHELLRRDVLQQPPAPEHVRRPRPPLRYLHAVLVHQHLPPVVAAAAPPGVRRRQQLLDAALARVAHVPPQRVLTYRPSKSIHSISNKLQASFFLNTVLNNID